MRASDATGDAGLRAPAYADLSAIGVRDSGRTAVVALDVAGELPARLAAGEVMGVGVDLFLGGRTESDYQLFAEGSADGWFGYLQTPQGFVRYPGSLYIGDGRLVFEVPWGSLGNPRQAEVTTFLDWSRRETPINAASQDRVPDRGTLELRR